MESRTQQSLSRNSKDEQMRKVGHNDHLTVGKKHNREGNKEHTNHGVRAENQIRYEECKTRNQKLTRADSTHTRGTTYDRYFTVKEPVFNSWLNMQFIVSS